MSILFFFLFITIIQYQNLMANTNVGTCSCDLNKGACDTSCCCDTDCSVKDMKAFNCNSQSNEDANAISSKTTVQSTCFKDLSIFKSNSPHVIQKKGDLICVDHERNVDKDSAYYTQSLNQKIDLSVLPRSMNIDNSVSSPVGTATNLTIYQVGTSVFRYISATGKATYYTLPVKILNSKICSGSQPITYLNDFTSSCTQPVTQETCNNALDTTKYTGSFCLITQPSALADVNSSPICCTGTGASSNWASSTCFNALQSLTLTINYLNPSGIVNCSIILNTTTSNTTVDQTLTVQFVQNGQTASNTLRSGNPGYLPEAPIIAGNSNGNIITTIPTGLTILQASTTASTTRDCSGTNRKVIRFGQNVQSTCLFSPNTSGSCPSTTDLSSIFLPYNSVNLYVAAYGNPDPSNITGYWLPVTFCTSEIGSNSQPVCQTGSVPSLSAAQCYIRLDIQIAYANIGSVTNPQPILGAVVFHYQRVTTTPTTSLLMTQTVTFQDVSKAPATDGDRIPRPNTRLPGDFFYPFTLNRGTNSVVFSSLFYLSVVFLFILM